MTIFVINLVMIAFLNLLLHSEASLFLENQKIAEIVDEEFIAFQQAVRTNQAKESLHYLYNNFESFKKDFEHYKANGVITKRHGEVDLNFKNFQIFIKKYVRVYNNTEEFQFRYGLFVKTQDMFKDEFVAGYKLAMARLADRTFPEQQIEHHKMLMKSYPH
uniref:Cathepsin propeptide inhibitor domain-containing protein n=1 Tax=Graphocephala atropunctata TaxID=36148 RepID=A0A1B6MV24_9HEMI